MNKPAQSFDVRRLSRHARLALIALAAALQCATLSAVEVDSAATGNATSRPQAEFSWISGGVGDDEIKEMRKAAAAYNVHLMFSNRQGHYLADIPFKVSKLDGRELYSGVSEGPLLYLKLPPGSYRIAVQLDSVWQNKRIRAGTSGYPARASFVGNGK